MEVNLSRVILVMEFLLLKAKQVRHHNHLRSPFHEKIAVCSCPPF